VIHGDGLDAPVFRGELEQVEPFVRSANAPERPGRQQLLDALEAIRHNQRTRLSEDALSVLAWSIHAMQVEGRRLTPGLDGLRLELHRHFDDV
jgi:hypothetical protein